MYILRESILLYRLSTLIRGIKWKNIQLDWMTSTLCRSAPVLILGFDLQADEIINANLEKLPDR